MQNTKIKVAFLDRDGVINKEVNYLHRIEDFEYTENCVEALKILNQLGYHIIIVTNQAGIARGYYSEAEYHALTSWYLNDLESNGVEVLDVFHCPHHPQGIIEEFSINCNCRKPMPGLINQALSKYNIEIANSFMVGDKMSDLLAGKNANISSLYLVRSGHAIEECHHYLEFENLFDVVNSLEGNVYEKESNIAYRST